MPDTVLFEEKLSYSIIGAFFEVYNTFGFGLAERIYVSALERELMGRGHRLGREVNVPVFYKEEEIGRQRIDLIVDERIVVEVKATPQLDRSAIAQTYSYLWATKLEVGLVLLFGLKPEFRRVICSNDRKRGHQPLSIAQRDSHSSQGIKNGELARG